jgi:hypothetical protein
LYQEVPGEQPQTEVTNKAFRLIAKQKALRSAPLENFHIGTNEVSARSNVACDRLQVFGMPFVVGVEKSQPVTSGCPSAGIPR